MKINVKVERARLKRAQEMVLAIARDLFGPSATAGVEQIPSILKIAIDQMGTAESRLRIAEQAEDHLILARLWRETVASARNAETSAQSWSADEAERVVVDHINHLNAVLDLAIDFCARHGLGFSPCARTGFMDGEFCTTGGGCLMGIGFFSSEMVEPVYTEALYECMELGWDQKMAEAKVREWSTEIYG